MKIKKVDDKPMMLHTKEKAKLHTHEPKSGAIKGSGVYTVKAKHDREQANELEYVDESQKADSTGSTGAANASGNTGGKPVRNPEREKPKWEDTITNRMMHWSYTTEQKEELKKALEAGVPKATMLEYFYPEVTVEKMSSYRKKQ